MVLISDDLPAPLSPTSAVTLPGGTLRSTSVRARTGPKVLVRCLSSSSAPPLSGLLVASPAGRRPEVLIVWPSAARCPSAGSGRGLMHLRRGYPVVQHW